MRLGDADLGIGAAVQLASVHQREHAREVRPGTRATAGRTAASGARRTAPGCRPAAPAPAASRSAFCSSAVWMRRSTSRTASRYSETPRAVAGAERPLQAREILVDAIEQAALLLHPVEPLFRRAAFAEQPLEHDARVVLGRQRRRRRLPRHRVHVGAAVARFALAAEDEIDFRRDQLHRRQHRVLAELRGRDLVGGRAVPDVRAFGVLRMDAGQPGGAGARVLAVAVAERFGLLLRQAADDRQPIAVRRERRQDRRQLEVRAGPFRRPVVDGCRSSRRRWARRRTPGGRSASAARLRCGGERRHHRVEQRQARTVGAEPAEEGPPGQRHLSVMIMTAVSASGREGC